MDPIINFFEENYPLSKASSWDNVGHLIQNQVIKNKKVLLTIDFTEKVLDECIQKNISIVVTYHPLIFVPLKNISYFYSKIIKNGINLFCFHTAADEKMNLIFLDKIFELSMNEEGLDSLNKKRKINFEEEIKKENNFVASRMNNLKIMRIIKNVKKICKLEKIRICYGFNQNYNSIPEKVFLGVGSSKFPLIKDSLIITGEMTHHFILEHVRNNNTIIMLEHCNSERWFLEILCEEMKKIENYEFFISESDKSPIEFA